MGHLIIEIEKEIVWRRWIKWIDEATTCQEALELAKDAEFDDMGRLGEPEYEGSMRMAYGFPNEDVAEPFWDDLIGFMSRRDRAQSLLMPAVKACLQDLERYARQSGPGPDRRLEKLKQVIAAIEKTPPPDQVETERLFMSLDNGTIWLENKQTGWTGSYEGFCAETESSDGLSAADIQSIHDFAEAWFPDELPEVDE